MKLRFALLFAVILFGGLSVGADCCQTIGDAAGCGSIEGDPGGTGGGGGGGGGGDPYAWLAALPESGWEDENIQTYLAYYLKCGSSGCVPYQYYQRGAVVITSTEPTPDRYHYYVTGVVLQHVIVNGKNAVWEWATAQTEELLSGDDVEETVGNNGQCDDPAGCLWRGIHSGDQDVIRYATRLVNVYVQPGNGRMRLMAAGYPGDGVTSSGDWNPSWRHRLD